MKLFLSIVSAMAALVAFPYGSSESKIGSLSDEDNVVTGVDFSEILPSVTSNGQTRLDFGKMRVGDNVVWAADGHSEETNIVETTSTNIIVVAGGITNVTVVSGGVTNTVVISEMVVTDVYATNIVEIIDGTNVVYVESHQETVTNWFGKYHYDYMSGSSVLGTVTVDTRNPTRDSSQWEDTYFYSYPYTRTGSVYPYYVKKGFPRSGYSFAPWCWFRTSAGQQAIVTTDPSARSETEKTLHEFINADASVGTYVLRFTGTSDPETSVVDVPAHYVTNIVSHVETNVTVTSVTNFVPREIQVPVDLYVTNITDRVDTNIVTQVHTNVIDVTDSALAGITSVIRGSGVVIAKSSGGMTVVSSNDQESVESFASAVRLAGVSGVHSTVRGSRIPIVLSGTNSMASASESKTGSQRRIDVDRDASVHLEDLRQVWIGGSHSTNGSVVGGSTLDSVLSDRIASEAPPPGEYSTVSNEAMTAKGFALDELSKRSEVRSDANRIVTVAERYSADYGDWYSVMESDGTVTEGYGHIVVSTNYVRSSATVPSCLVIHAPSNLSASARMVLTSTASYVLQTQSFSGSDTTITWTLDGQSARYPAGSDSYYLFPSYIGTSVSYDLRTGLFYVSGSGGYSPVGGIGPIDVTSVGDSVFAMSKYRGGYTQSLGIQVTNGTARSSYFVKSPYVGHVVGCKIRENVEWDPRFVPESHNTAVSVSNLLDAVVTETLPEMRSRFGTSGLQIESEGLHVKKLVSITTNKVLSASDRWTAYESHDGGATWYRVSLEGGISYDPAYNMIWGKVLYYPTDSVLSGYKVIGFGAFRGSSGSGSASFFTGTNDDPGSGTSSSGWSSRMTGGDLGGYVNINGGSDFWMTMNSTVTHAAFKTVSGVTRYVRLVRSYSAAYVRNETDMGKVMSAGDCEYRTVNGMNVMILKEEN